MRPPSYALMSMSCDSQSVMAVGVQLSMVVGAVPKELLAAIRGALRTLLGYRTPSPRREPG